MKKIAALIGFSLILGLSYGQNEWNNTNNPTSSMYRSGNVGIGTASAPSDKLRISGGNVMLDYAPSGSIGNLYFGGNTESQQNGMRLFAIQSGFYGGGYIDVRTTSLNNEGIHFRVDNSLGGTERMRICSNGKVGIGTTAPYSKLHIDGDLFVTGNSGNSTIFIGDNNAQPQYGFEYLAPAPGQGVAGMNFWKPYGSVNGSGGQGFQNYILFLNDDGNVGIGVPPANINSLYKLSVNGTIRAKEIVVETGWADFVFEPNYNLMSLEDLEKFIDENSHLPEIPSATDVLNNGVSVGEMESKLLQKIEELTLYIIQQNKRIEALEKQINK